jgi:hypothetical protein
MCGARAEPQAARWRPADAHQRPISPLSVASLFLALPTWRACPCPKRTRTDVVVRAEAWELTHTRWCSYIGAPVPFVRRIFRMITFPIRKRCGFVPVRPAPSRRGSCARRDRRCVIAARPSSRHRATRPLTVHSIPVHDVCQNVRRHVLRHRRPGRRSHRARSGRATRPMTGCGPNTNRRWRPRTWCSSSEPGGSSRR